MNILLITPFSVGETGGVTTFVTRLQDGVNQSASNKALLLVPGGCDRVSSEGAGERSGTYAVYLRPMYVPGAIVKGFVAFWLYLPVTLYHLWAFLRRNQIDVVHVHFPAPCALYFSVLRLWSRWKLLVTLHGSDIYALPNRTWWFRTLVGLLLFSADAIVAGTAHLIQSFQARYPRIRTRTRVVPNGATLVDCSAAPAAQLPEDYILSVGNLIPRKGHDVLLRAVAIARDMGHDLKVVIVGDGPCGPALKALADQLKVADLVAFAGHVAHRDVLPFHAAARFFVHPALEEAQGLVLVESMSCRKAVLATRVLGVPELVRDGDTGLLVEPGDPVALAQALITLNTDSSLRERLGRRAHELVTQEHTWDRFLARYGDIYRELAA